MGLADSYKRWRHGRGFGVHSPLAYDLVMNTLREREAYYAYNRLDNASSGGAISPRQLRLIFRLLVRFNPHKVAIIDDDPDALLKLAAKSANSHCNFVKSIDEADFVIVNKCKDIALQCLDSTKVYLFLSEKNEASKVADRVWSRINNGLRLDNHCGMSIIIAKPGISKQQIDVRF